VLVLVAVGVVLAVGIAESSRTAVDVLPEFQPTSVQIQTEALGLSANEVEQFITVPLEDEFNGVPFVDHLRSKSVPGLSAITLTFKPGTDLYAARQLVTERVAQGPSVVNVGTPPVMLEPLSSERRVMMIGLSSLTVPIQDLSTTAYWRIRPRILSVPGVANVSIWGQRDIQLQVLFDPARANKAGVTLEQVLNTAGDATWTSPLSFLEASSPGADGLIDMPNQRLTVQHILPIRTPADLAQMPIEETEGKLVHIGDVATVVQSHPPLRGDAVLPAGAGLILVVQKLPGANTLAVTRGIEAAMTDLKPGLNGVSVDTSLFRPATYLETALKNIGIAALIGFLLLAAWLGVAMRSWRIAVIGIISIALPVVSAMLVLQAFGVSFNIMTLAGLVIALGVIVDDAIVGAGTLRLHLERHNELGDPHAEAEIAWETYAEMRRPMVWAVAVLLLAMAPLLLLGGLAGSFVTPIVIAYSLAVLASTAAALVVMPVVAGALFRLGSPTATERSRSGLAESLDRTWTAVIRQPAWTYLAIVVLVALGAASLSQIRPSPLVPQLQDRNLLVQWQAAPGTSLVEMDRVMTKVGAELRSTRGVRGAASHVGQALLGDQPVNVNSAETWITLDPKADYASAVASIQQVLGGYGGLSHTLLNYPQQSMDAAPANSGKALTVRIYGTDPKLLASSAEGVQQVLSSLQGVTVDAKVQTQTVEPAVQIQTIIPAAARYGLKPGDIRRQTAVLIAGIPVGSYYHDEQIFDVTMWSEPAVRDNLLDVGNLVIAASGGARVPLNRIARVTIQQAPAEIDHDRASRYVDVTASVAGGNLDDVVRLATERMRSLDLPLGYHAEVTSDLQAARSSDLDLWLAALGALVGVYLLLQAAFRSWGRSALVLFTLPLAAMGVLPAALIAGASVTLGVLVGLVLVLGVALRNGMLLVRSFQRVESQAAETPADEIVLAATREVAAPVAVAAVGIALVFLPFVASGTIAGMEILCPLGAAVTGGLVTSTLLTLVVLPTLYLRFFARKPDATHPETQGEAQ
jgi:Cu/Ag efflux pump CusA